MVVVSAAGMERECRKDVKALGFTCYQPVERVVTVTRGRKVHSERLYLGRYFFARTDPSAPNWRSILPLRRVFGLLMRVDEELPALAHDSEIERFRAIEDEDGFINGDAPLRQPFLPGAKVRASAGTFIGFCGEYLNQSRDCDWAELELFGRKTKIGFGLGVLQAA